MFAWQKAGWKRLTNRSCISRRPAGPGRGRWHCSSSSSSPASSQTSPWSAPSAGPAHSGSPATKNKQNKCSIYFSVDWTRSFKVHNSPKYHLLWSVQIFSSYVWSLKSSRDFEFCRMRFSTCSPAPWPPPSTMVLVTLFSISESRERWQRQTAGHQSGLTIALCCEAMLGQSTLWAQAFNWKQCGDR